MNINRPVFKIREEVRGLHFSPTLGINEQVALARAQGKDLVHLGFGESPFPVHPLIQDALAAHADKNMYLPSAGLPELRKLARDYFAEKFGFDGMAFQAIIGPGSKELIYDIQLAVEGDLLLPIPSWVSYGPQAALTGDQVIKIPTTIGQNYHITAESLEAAILAARQAGKNPRKLILNYPNNPTGLTLSPQVLAQIARVCEQYGILVISDEIYGLVNHQANHTSIARHYPQGTVITSGLSKHLSLGGYRLGVALVPKALEAVFDAVVRIASETWSTVSAPIQYAALKAFEKDREIEDYIRTCTQIHSLVSEYLRQVLVRLGIHYPQLAGAFYLYPDFGVFREALNRRGICSSEDLARDLIEAVQLASLPGTAFGDSPSTLALRLACCDYEGGAALKYYKDHPGCTMESLVRRCCPNIRSAGQRLDAYFKDLGL
jgi:aspartate aminotransferase